MVVCWFWQKFQFSKIAAKEAKTQIGPFVFFVFFCSINFNCFIIFFVFMHEVYEPGLFKSPLCLLVIVQSYKLPSQIRVEIYLYNFSKTVRLFFFFKMKIGNSEYSEVLNTKYLFLLNPMYPKSSLPTRFESKSSCFEFIL